MNYPVTASRELVQPDVKDEGYIEILNRQFIDYINFGAYPEAATSKDVRDKVQQYVAADVIEKVLRRDLPSLYRIEDPRIE